MTKKSTKRALLLSALSLLLCVSMLIGSTFAWFTDSVTSAGNTIQSGTLDVDLVDANDKSLEGEVIDFVAADGRDTILWEPGCTYKTEEVFVVNNGNLALKYKVGINGINGDAKLLEAIEWTVTVGGTDYALSSLQGELQAGQKSGAIVLSGHMKEEAGNEYQDLTVEGISITVFATQLTAEVDSFNDQYDAMATVDTVDELNKALAEKSVKIVLGSDIVLTEGIVIAADQEVEIDLAGYTMSMTDDSDASDSIAMLLNNGNLTIDDSVGTGKMSYKYTGTDLGTTYAANTVRTHPGSTLTVKGGTIENLTFDSAVIAYAIDALTNGGNGDVKVDIVGGKISSLRQSIRVFANSTTDTGTLNISGGDFYGRVIVQNANAKDNLAALNISGGTFVANEYKEEVLYVGGSAGASMANIQPVISNGTFNGKVHVSVPNSECITGGTFSVDPSAYVVIGYKADLVGDRYEVVEYATVASTAAELNKALANGDNVVLNNDIELTSTLMAKKDAVIDLNGNTMTAPSSGAMFQSQSNAAPDITITSSKSGAKINAGNNAVLLGYGSTEIYNVEINVDTINSSNNSTFKVYGDLTLGEGTVVNVNYLGASLINNNGAVKIVIDGAKINVGEFKVNGGSMISINQATTVEMNNTEITVGLNTTYTSYFVSQENKATINNCTFNVVGSDSVQYTVSETGKQWVAAN